MTFKAKATTPAQHASHTFLSVPCLFLLRASCLSDIKRLALFADAGPTLGEQEKSNSCLWLAAVGAKEPLSMR